MSGKRIEQGSDITPFRARTLRADYAAYYDDAGWWIIREGQTFHLRDLRVTYHAPVLTFDTLEAAIAHYREVTA